VVHSTPEKAKSIEEKIVATDPNVELAGIVLMTSISSDPDEDVSSTSEKSEEHIISPSEKPESTQNVSSYTSSPSQIQPYISELPTKVAKIDIVPAELHLKDE